jgi:hypothetical protein
MRPIAQTWDNDRAMHPAIAEGVRLFNSQKFFEAHEALETLWLSESGDERLFLHGLIQVAAAFHHYQRNNAEGFRRVLAKGMSKLKQFSGAGHGINVDALRRDLDRWADRGAGGYDLEHLPEIKLYPSRES